MRLVTTCQACQTKGNRHLHEKWHSLFDLSSCGFWCLYRLVQACTRVYKQLAQRLMNVNEVNKTSLASLWQGKACYWKKKNFKFYIESCNNNWWYVMFVVMLSPVYNHTFASVQLLTLERTVWSCSCVNTGLVKLIPILSYVSPSCWQLWNVVLYAGAKGNWQQSKVWPEWRVGWHPLQWG